jgi:hypothetical protein
MCRTKDEITTVRGDMELTMNTKLEQANSQVMYL